MAKRFDEWEVVEQLPQGGQAYIYLVRKTGDSDGRLFVLKRLINKGSPARLERFRREIEVCSTLSHPNVLTMVSYNLQHEHPYLVTELCSGGTLALCEMGDWSDADRLRTFALICRGVGHANSKGVIHRDLKPENIFLNSNPSTPVVGDFGLCLLANLDTRLTEINEAIGARWYMAPELEDGLNLEVGPVADVYSLGKLLYWIFAGRMFSREKHRTGEYDLTRDRSDAAVFFVYDLLDGTIVSDPKERHFADANELAHAVEIAIRRIEMNAHHIDLSVPQACNYCGLGNYQLVLDASRETQGVNVVSAVQSFGFYGGTNEPIWLIFVCDHCGNVQIFRPDHTDDRDIWKRGS